MLQRDFLERLVALNSASRSALVSAGVIEDGDEGAWIDFRRDPMGYFLRAKGERSERLWSMVRGDRPGMAHDCEEAIADLQDLFLGFGMPAGMRMWPWIKGRLEELARHGERCRELLEANNRHQQTARDYRRIAYGEQSGIFVVSAPRHAPTWRMMRADGLPIISSWIDQVDGDTLPAVINGTAIKEATMAKVAVVYVPKEEYEMTDWLSVGAALGSGVPVLTCVPQEFHPWHLNMFQTFNSLDAAMSAASDLAAG